jgi:hypothetical protein
MLDERRERLEVAIAVLDSVGEKRVGFRAEDFLLSFGRPNFYFHASMAHGILRTKGVPVGKIDCLGKLRFQRPACRSGLLRRPVGGRRKAASGYFAL